MTKEGKPASGAISRRQAARLLPQTRFGGPIPWVIAILIALVVIFASGGLALQNLAKNARGDLADAVTVQIIEADAAVRAERAQATAAALASQPVVRSVRIVPEEELAALLEPWLGEGADTQDVPIPALIDVELTGEASAQQIEELQAVLDRAVPGTKVDADSTWLKPVYDALAAVQWLAIALIALVAFATAAAVWLAARNAFAEHHDTVEIIHLLGGTDKQITRIFQRSVMIEAAFGGILGLAAGLLTVWLLGQQFAALDSGMIGGTALGWADWLVIAAIPIAGILLAMVTGRITISLALRAML
ncbi:MAG: cell division protein [Pseudomonadota bacterium]|nr:cell division protein [Pseudomonadota bacterium]